MNLYKFTYEYSMEVDVEEYVLAETLVQAVSSPSPSNTGLNVKSVQCLGYCRTELAQKEAAT